jgi:hypothetical protein
VIIVCAGEPANLPELEMFAPGAKFIIAASGTSPEDLREVAMRRASGDIVTLVSRYGLSRWHAVADVPIC